MVKNEALVKSIDSFVDEFFAKSEAELPKAAIAEESKTTADAVVGEAPAPKKDDKDRPKQLTDVPQIDTDGKREGNYDADITTKTGEIEPEEVKANAVPETLTKSEKEELEAFRKAKKEAEEASKKDDSKKLIKSVIMGAVEKVSNEFVTEIEALKKSFNEQSDLIKSLSAQPKVAKSITNVSALEKSEKEVPLNKSLSRKEYKDMAMDAAESLSKSMPEYVNEDHICEIDMTGRVADPRVAALIEAEVNKKFR